MEDVKSVLKIIEENGVFGAAIIGALSLWVVIDRRLVYTPAMVKLSGQNAYFRALLDKHGIEYDEDFDGEHEKPKTKR